MKTYEIVRDAEVLAEFRCNQLERFGSGQTLQLFDRHGLPFLSAIIMKCELREKIEPADACPDPDPRPDRGGRGEPPEGAAA